MTMLEGTAAQQLLDRHPAAVIAEIEPDDGPARSSPTRRT
jgi:hypothetical protein